MLKLATKRNLIWTVAIANTALGTSTFVYAAMGGGWTGAWFAFVAVVTLELWLLHAVSQVRLFPKRRLHKLAVAAIILLCLTIQLTKVFTHSPEIIKPWYVTSLEVVLASLSVLSISYLILAEGDKTLHVESAVQASKTSLTLHVEKTSLTAAPAQEEPVTVTVSKPPEKRLPSPVVNDNSFPILPYTNENIADQLASGMSTHRIAKYHEQHNAIKYGTGAKRAQAVRARVAKGASA